MIAHRGKTAALRRRSNLYRSFSKKQFERILIVSKSTVKGKAQPNLKHFSDISAEIYQFDMDNAECVYRYQLRNRAVSIIIYSSVNIYDERCADKGLAAVRLYLEWNIGGGTYLYKHSGQLKRDGRLEQKLGNALRTLAKESYSLPRSGWHKSINEAYLAK